MSNNINCNNKIVLKKVVYNIMARPKHSFSFYNFLLLLKDLYAYHLLTTCP